MVCCPSFAFSNLPLGSYFLHLVGPISATISFVFHTVVHLGKVHMKKADWDALHTTVGNWEADAMHNPRTTLFTPYHRRELGGWCDAQPARLACFSFSQVHLLFYIFDVQSALIYNLLYNCGWADEDAHE